MSPAKKGIIALIIANLIWGFASPIFKWSMENVPPFTLAFWRFFLGTLFLALFIGKRLKLPKFSKKEWWALFFYAQSGIVGNIIFFLLGLQLTLAMNAPVIASAAPIMTFLVAPFLLKEKIPFRKGLGMGIGTVGILVIVLEPILMHGMDGSILGNSFLVLATIGYVISIIIGKKIFQEFDPVLLMFWAFVISALSFIPFALFEFIKNPHLYAALNYQGYIGIGFGALFSSAIAYTLFSWGLSKIPASEASMFAYVDPIAGTVLSYFMLHEPITGPFLWGAFLIFGGILIAEHRINYHPLQKVWKKVVT